MMYGPDSIITGAAILLVFGIVWFFSLVSP